MSNSEPETPADFTSDLAEKVAFQCERRGCTTIIQPGEVFDVVGNAFKAKRVCLPCKEHYQAKTIVMTSKFFLFNIRI